MAKKKPKDSNTVTVGGITIQKASDADRQAAIERSNRYALSLGGSSSSTGGSVPKSQPREGDYVPGKGILTPTGSYRPTSAESGSLASSGSSFDAKTEGYGYESGGNFIPFRNDEVAARAGYYGEDAANAITYRDAGILEPKMSKGESLKLAKEYGLQGMNDKDFEGLTRSQAIIKANQLKKEKQGQVSSMTSFAFNPESMSNFKNKFKEMTFKLDENTDYPFSNRQEKKNKQEAIIKSYTDQFASLFNTPEEFQAATQDLNFQKTLKEYERAGGSTEDILASIGKTQPQQAEQQGNMDIDTYLGNLSTPADQKAFDSLIPEKQIYQDQIAFEQNIPKQYRDLYFGTPEQVGLVQQRRQQAEEEIKLLERQAKADERNMRAQADFAIERNNKEMELEAATIEENRLAAKNYMTGMLAKLGALNTTGEAPKAIATLEQKYQQQAQKLRTGYDFANREIQLKMNENIDNIQLERDADILKTKGDLSKSEEEVWKDIFKMQNDADRKTFSIIEKYTQEFRTQKEKYTKEAKAEAEKYAKEFSSLVSGYDFDTFIGEKQNEQQMSFTSDTRQGYVPDFVQKIINSGEASLDLESVLRGEAKLSDFTPSTATKIRREMTALGISEKMLKGGQELPSETDALKEAKDAIDEGADPVAVRQRFLENYPEKSALFNAYFKE